MYTKVIINFVSMQQTKTQNNMTNLTLFSQNPLSGLDLKKPYFTSHLITYIGNKRRLLPFLHKSFLHIQEKLGKEKLVILDGFTGSGAVARLLKSFAGELHVNDLEDYSETINRSYLANKSEVDLVELEKYINWLNENRLNSKRQPGFIETNYAPKDENNIQQGERVFYTNINARIIDNIRALIEEKIPKPYREFCLASLLIKASINNNTSGVFKGFHKKDGVGHFGGQGENALSRIKREIILEMPIFSDYECSVQVHKRDINELVNDKALPEFDLVYYDPPYNQHPYGSNYFMLNIINAGKPREIQDGVSGIAKNWNKSCL
jgi:adenine-specific DNA-methyltransferase